METEPGKKRPMKPKVVLAVLAAVAALVALPVVASGATLGGIISSGMVVYEDNYDLSVDGYVFTSQEATEGITVEDDVYGTVVYPCTSTVYDSQGNTVLTTTASDYMDAITNGGVTVTGSMFTENSSMLLTYSYDSSYGDRWGLCTVTGTTVMPAIYESVDVDSSGTYAVGCYASDSGVYVLDVYDLSTCSKLQTITDSTWVTDFTWHYDLYAYFTEIDGATYLHVFWYKDTVLEEDEDDSYYVLSGGTFVETSYKAGTTYSSDDDDYDDYDGGTYTAADGTEFTLTETSSGALTLTVNGSTYTLASGSGSDRYDSYSLEGDWIDVETYSGNVIIYSYLGTKIAEFGSYYRGNYYYLTGYIITTLGSSGNYLLSTTTSVSDVESDDDDEDNTSYSYTCALYTAAGTKIKDIDADGSMYLSSTYSDTPWGTVYLVSCSSSSGTVFLGYDEEMNPITVGGYQLAGISYGLKRQNAYVYYVMDTGTGRYGAVNASGSVVIPVEYTAMYDPRYTSSSYLLVQKSDGLWYVYDASAVDSANKTIASVTSAGTTTAKKKANTMKVKVSTKTVKAKKLKKTKQTVKAITVKKAKGKVTYKKVSGSKKLTVNKKTGKITLKKGLKKGTYKIKVKVKAAGTSKYKAMTKTVTVKIKVK